MGADKRKELPCTLQAQVGSLLAIAFHPHRKITGPNQGRHSEHEEAVNQAHAHIHTHVLSWVTLARKKRQLLGYYFQSAI